MTQQERDLALKLEVFAAYSPDGEICCACCGEDWPLFLTLDHKYGCGVARRKIEGSGMKLYRRLKRAEYPPGFRVLCFNCNFASAWRGGICPHQSTIHRG